MFRQLVLRILAIFILLPPVGRGIAAETAGLLEGPDVVPMQEALQRLGHDFRLLKKADTATLKGLRVLILCGSAPPVSQDEVATVRGFLEEGGGMLAVGGGARWAIEHELLDASGYYPAGSTIHQTQFEGIHPLVAGYPGEKPKQNWVKGVPMLFRLTNGPLMELGPSATSILTYGPPFTAAAIQPVGEGVILAIGPDPQGGDVYYSLEKATPTTGEEQGTDRLLDNAFDWLMNRDEANLLPNSSFDHELSSPREYSGWNTNGRRGGQIVRKDSSYLELTGSAEDSVAVLIPAGGIVVEAGRTYHIGARYQANARWSIRPTLLRGRRPGLDREALDTLWIEPAESWTEMTRDIHVPKGVTYLTFDFMLTGQGSVSLDDVSLTLAEKGGKS